MRKSIAVAGNRPIGAFESLLQRSPLREVFVLAEGGCGAAASGGLTARV